MPANAISIQNLKKYFGQTKAVDGISLDIAPSEIFGFLGPNGAGKTTTIRCLMDFIRPTSGSISILGLDSQKDSVNIKKEVGFLSGDVRLYDNWTGTEHFSLVENLNGKSDILLSLIERLDFNPKIKAKTLSSGNKQKLGLILALMHQPQVLILDEPTVGLDPLLQNTIYEILREFRKKGCTIFMSSHNLREVEVVCDRVGIIKNGKMVALETIANLKRLALHKVKAYFEKPIDPALFDHQVDIIKSAANFLEMQTKGDINALIKTLSQQKLQDLEIERASLEDIFMEYYRKEI
ncbi:MAG TPA: ABC transporter [Candidatus Blackburnbacteria bacterium]|nr:ABC transporter [Candidatus Blackburnbacteria bacterium]